MKAIVLAIGLSLAACAHKPPPPVSAEEHAAIASRPDRFGDLRLGMTQHQVLIIMGPPDGLYSWNTWRVWVPLNPGVDTTRYRYHYRGQGQVTFAAGIADGFAGSVIAIQPDAADPGRE